MNHYYFRINVRQPCEQQYMWRVFENNKEIQNAGHINIFVKSYSEITTDPEPDRFGRYTRNNIACDGYAVWDGTTVNIVEQLKS